MKKFPVYYVFTLHYAPYPLVESTLPDFSMYSGADAVEVSI